MGAFGHGSESLSPEESVRERAQRVSAMLKRWETENASDEPIWDVDDIAPLRINSGTPARS